MKLKNVLILVVILALSFVIFKFVDSDPVKISLHNYLSPESQTKLDTLNAKYRLISVKDLSEMNGNILRSTSIKADILKFQDSENKLGVITEIEYENQTLTLSWQPENDLSNDELKKIAEEFKKEIPEVKSAEADQKIELMTTQAEIELEKLKTDQRVIEGEDLMAKLQVIAVIDSGLYQYNKDFDKSRIYKQSLNWNFATDSKNIKDTIGHGTHIAGIISQNSKNPLMILSIFDPQDKSSKLSYLLSALQYAEKNGASIINLSLGVRDESKILEKKIDELYKKNIVVVAGAGNDGTSEKIYPAAYSNVIAIASVNKRGEKSEISNYGAWVDFAALGEDVLSYKNARNGYRYMSGTSQAAALATARIAGAMAEEEYKNINQLEKLLDTKISGFSSLKKEYRGLIGKGIISD